MWSSWSVWAWIAALTRGMGVAQDGDREPAREVEVLPAVRVPQPMALAADPGALEVAREHG